MRCNGVALRTIRERSGFSISSLARAAGISQPHLTNIEKGDRQPSPEVLLAIARELKVDLPAILADPAPAPS